MAIIIYAASCLCLQAEGGALVSEECRPHFACTTCAHRTCLLCTANHILEEPYSEPLGEKFPFLICILTLGAAIQVILPCPGYHALPYM